MEKKTKNKFWIIKTIIITIILSTIITSFFLPMRYSGGKPFPLSSNFNKQYEVTTLLDYIIPYSVADAPEPISIIYETTIIEFAFINLIIFSALILIKKTTKKQLKIIIVILSIVILIFMSKVLVKEVERLENKINLEIDKKYKVKITDKELIVKENETFQKYEGICDTNQLQSLMEEIAMFNAKPQLDKITLNGKIPNIIHDLDTLIDEKAYNVVLEYAYDGGLVNNINITEINQNNLD